MTNIEIYLQPGEVMFAGEDTWLVTLLGSCVAITVWHAKKRWGGMCHIMLPDTLQRKNTHGDGRYAQEAVQLLKAAIRQAGVKANELEVKLFGGGTMLNQSAAMGKNIGALSLRNIDVAKQLIAQAGWNLVAEHTGGRGHRQLKFDVNSGEVWLRYTPLPDCRFCTTASGVGAKSCGGSCG